MLLNFWPALVYPRNLRPTGHRIILICSCTDIETAGLGIVRPRMECKLFVGPRQGGVAVGSRRYFAEPVQSKGEMVNQPAEVKGSVIYRWPNVVRTGMKIADHVMIWALIRCISLDDGQPDPWAIYVILREAFA